MCLNDALCSDRSLKGIIIRFHILISVDPVLIWGAVYICVDMMS